MHGLRASMGMQPGRSLWSLKHVIIYISTLVCFFFFFLIIKHFIT